MIEIVKYTFLLCVAIIAALIVLCFILFLFSKYPIRTNLAVVIFLLILGVPILYIPVIYFTTIALVCIIIGLIFWISSMGESKKAVKYSESSSKKEMMTEIGRASCRERV